jgi:hypothetical protein
MSFGGKIKRNIADKHFSDCIRKAAEWKCQRCEKDYTDRPQGLQCSHYISRGHWSVRYDPKNALSLCAYCHNYSEGFPTAHTQLWREIHGGIHGRDETDASLNALLQREACKSRAQYARNNIKAISAHYREESKRLDGELIKAKEGKANVDLTVYGYTKPKTPRDPRRPT